MGGGPGVILILCGFVVFTTGCFILSLALLFVLVQSCLALWSPRLGKRELVYVLLVHLFVYFERVNFCPFSLPLPGLAVAFDCGTPWTFLLTVLVVR